MTAMKRTLPSQAYLCECFDYNPHSGHVLWRPRPGEHFLGSASQKRFNVRFAGQPAGNIRHDGRYRVVGITVDGERHDYLLHRLIWKIVHGSEPDEVDHKNRDGLDNRLHNLREASSRQNKVNTKLNRRNTSGSRGVDMLPGGTWRAAIRRDGRSMHIGCFPTKEAAASAYQAKAIELHGEFAGQMDAA